ncbi:MAG: hypothetical protein ACI9LO_001111 [Planctomycetota bacterium]|jgi:hypothetical protein
MSKININDVDSYIDDAEELEDDNSDAEDRLGNKLKLRVRRKIELLNDRRKMKAMNDTEDSYWDD